MKNSQFLTIVFILSLLAAFFLGFFVGNLIRSSDHTAEITELPSPVLKTESPTESPMQSPEYATSAPETTEPIEQPVSDLPEDNSNIDLSTLKISLDSKFAGYASDWIVLVEDLDSGDQITVSTNGLTAASPVTSASVIKLFIAGAIYDNALKSGDKIDELTEISLKNMISASDNESANNLIRTLGNGDESAGKEAVNAFIQSIGCTSTVLNRLFLAEGDENLVSASDCAAVLRMIYNGTYVSQQASEDILNMMKAQERISKIPSGLIGFEGVSSANKTGELYAPDHDNTENDVAIIYTPGGDYILCILATKINNSTEAIATFTEVSREVCEFYNPSE